MVEDLHIDRCPIRKRCRIPHHGIICRDEIEECLDRGVLDIVEIASPVFRPFPLQVARGDGHLVFFSPDDCLKIDKVRIIDKQEGTHPVRIIMGWELIVTDGQPMLFPVLIARQFIPPVISHLRQTTPDECAIINDLTPKSSIWESLIDH